MLLVNRSTNLAVFQFLFSHIAISLIFITPVSNFTLRGSGCEATGGAPKICKPASRPTGFGENFSIRPAGRLKIFTKSLAYFLPVRICP